MSILSNFEDRVATLFEGVAGTLFRSPVEPVQIARAAGKEMSRNKLVGPGRTYAPTLYTVLLSPEDDDNLSRFYSTLSAEIATYLIGRAKEASLYLPSKPLVRFLVDEQLTTGKFAVFAENVSEDELVDLRGACASDEPAPAVLVNTPTTRPMAARPGAWLVDVKTGERIALVGDELVLGRDETCDITVNDINVSRSHSRVIAEGSGWAVEDLGSTNGTFVNGERVQYLRLVPGDTLTVGVSRFEYRED